MLWHDNDTLGTGARVGSPFRTWAKLVTVTYRVILFCQNAPGRLGRDAARHERAHPDGCYLLCRTAVLLRALNERLAPSNAPATVMSGPMLLRPNLLFKSHFAT